MSGVFEVLAALVAAGMANDELILVMDAQLHSRSGENFTVNSLPVYSPGTE